MSFELVVNNGSFNSFADTVQVTVKNDAPTADAGEDQIYSDAGSCLQLPWMAPGLLILRMSR